MHSPTSVICVPMLIHVCVTYVPILIHVCVTCVPIQLEPQLHDIDITTVRAVERFGLGLGLMLGLGLGFRLGLALGFWVRVRVSVLG